MGRYLFNSKKLLSFLVVFSLFSAFAITNFVGCSSDGGKNDSMRTKRLMHKMG